MVKTKLQKSICGFLFIALVPVFAQTNIHSLVGVVRPNYYSSMVSFLEEYRDNLKKNGYSTYSKYVDSYLAGGFGSGFVYVAENGDNYIITNRHVISQAESASIEFEDPSTGKITRYENLSIYATDEDIDIALLAFPKGEKPFKEGLAFGNLSVQDGDDVWSAGFPCLSTDPVWQLGKGTVTNANARIKELLNPEISKLIQHSAQIDSGNSGGPLLVISPANAGGYLVVGVNTWKAVYRQSTNFSIPAPVIINFIKDATIPKTTFQEEELFRKKIEDFLDSFNKQSFDFISIARYISYELTSKRGKEDFEAVLNYAPTSVRSTVVNMFGSEPFEGLRYATAYRIWKEYRFEDDIKYELDELKKEEASFVVEMKNNVNKNTVKTMWNQEQSLWRLTTIEGNVSGSNKISTNENKSSAGFKVTFPKLESGKKIILKIAGNFPISSSFKAYEGIYSGDDFTLSTYEASTGFNANISFYPKILFFFDNILGFGLGYGYEKIETIDTHSFLVNFDLRLPLNMTDLIIEPYATISGSIALLEDPQTAKQVIGLGYVWNAGLVCYVDFHWPVTPGIGFAFEQYYTRFNTFNIKRDCIKAFIAISF